MQAVKIIGIFGLIAGLAGQSQAGFRDALKAAAGSALNEVAGTANVTNLVSGKTSAEDAKSLTSGSVANTAQAEIKNCVVKDESSVSKEAFMKANNFSDAEYLQWLGAVTRELAGTRTPVSGIPAEGIVFDNYRLTLPSDEAGNTANGGILLSQEYAYFLSGNTCIKFNYTTLAAGHCDERGDIMRNPESGRVIDSIEKCCDSAKQKISS